MRLAKLFPTLSAAVLAIGLGVTAVPAPSAAQQSPVELIEGLVTDDFAKSMQIAVLRNIKQAKCDKDSDCSPATPAELEKPPLTMEMAKNAAKAGLRSGIAEWCALDWEKRSFGVLLADLKKANLNKRQMTVAILIHHHQHERFMEGRVGGPFCPEASRADIDKKLPKG